VKTTEQQETPLLPLQLKLTKHRPANDARRQRNTFISQAGHDKIYDQSVSEDFIVCRSAGRE
jgi:hypothetical protein